MLVTSFGDLQIGVMTACREDSAPIRKRDLSQIVKFLNALSGECFFDHFADCIIGCGSDNRVHLRKGLSDLIRVALGHTAAGNQCPAASFLFICSHLKKAVDGLLLRFGDKAAGIHDDHICLLFIVRQVIISLADEPEHLFRIHAVFITAQRNKQDLCLWLYH